MKLFGSSETPNTDCFSCSRLANSTAASRPEPTASGTMNTFSLLSDCNTHCTHTQHANMCVYSTLDMLHINYIFSIWIVFHLHFYFLYNLLLLLLLFYGYSVKESLPSEFSFLMRRNNKAILNLEKIYTISTVWRWGPKISFTNPESDQIWIMITTSSYVSYGV